MNYGTKRQKGWHDASNEPTAFIRLPTNTGSINISTHVHRAVKHLPIQPITRQVHRESSTTKVRRLSIDIVTNTNSARSIKTKNSDNFYTVTRGIKTP